MLRLLNIMLWFVILYCRLRGIKMGFELLFLIVKMSLSFIKQSIGSQVLFSGFMKEQKASHYAVLFRSWQPETDCMWRLCKGSGQLVVLACRWTRASVCQDCLKLTSSAASRTGCVAVRCLSLSCLQQISLCEKD